MVVAKWSGVYPHLCHGEWSLTVNGVDVSDKIPADLRKKPMNTCKAYSRWYFAEDWDVRWVNHMAGVPCGAWIEANKHWLDTITTDAGVQAEIFHAINAEDWRHGSCGGCI